MAFGDLHITKATNNGAGTIDIDIQPGAGEVWKVTSIIAYVLEHHASAHIIVSRYDGANAVQLCRCNGNFDANNRAPFVAYGGYGTNQTFQNQAATDLEPFPRYDATFSPFLISFRGPIYINNSEYLRLTLTSNGAADRVYVVEAIEVSN